MTSGTLLPFSLKSVSWKHAAQFANRKPDAAWRDWLLHPGSLTARLKKGAGSFGVIKLVSSTQAVFGHEAGLFREYARGRPVRAVVREVILLRNQEAVVYARTIMPWSSLGGSNLRLLSLNTRPLADILFQGKGVARGPIGVGRVSPLISPDSPLSLTWGRRSLFFPDGHPILVTEVFVPDFLARVAMKLRT